MKTLLVETWCENTQEGIGYLTYNNYGERILRISKRKFLCFDVDLDKMLGLDDVKILKQL